MPENPQTRQTKEVPQAEDQAKAQDEREARFAEITRKAKERYPGSEIKRFSHPKFDELYLFRVPPWSEHAEVMDAAGDDQPLSENVELLLYKYLVYPEPTEDLIDGMPGALPLMLSNAIGAEMGIVADAGKFVKNA